jgi:hypothetical protein
MPPNPSPDRALNAILPLISSNQPYEAHQKARTFASRYTKASQFDTAIEVLFQSGRELLKAGQAGSGTDLGCFLVDVYTSKGVKIDDETRGRLTQLIALTGASGTWRKTLIDKCVSWSTTASDYPPGDPDLHHYIGELLYKEGAFEAAESHFIASGKRDSARILAVMMFEWSRGGAEPGAYASRGTIPYLLVGNILAARTFLSQYLSTLLSTRPALLVETLTVVERDEIAVTTDPTLNFLQLLVRTCQRAGGSTPEYQREARNAWVRLLGRYQNQGGPLSRPEMKQAIVALGAEYFDIQPPRQTNPLADMVSSLFGGPGGNPSSGPRFTAGRGRGHGAGPAPAGLD